MNRNGSRYKAGWLLLAALVLGLMAPEESFSKGGLRLRVQGSVAVADGLAAVVVRTYSSRPIMQGQICLRIRRSRTAAATRNLRSSPGSAQLLYTSSGPGQLLYASSGPAQLLRTSAGPPRLLYATAGPSQFFPTVPAPTPLGHLVPAALSALPSSSTGELPFLSLERSEVFSAAGDAVTTAVLFQAGDEQIVMVDFTSASRTVNAVEGVLAALHLRVSSLAQRLDTFDVTIDPQQTMLFDDRGRSVDVLPRPGDLRIRGPEDAITFDVDGDRVTPGEVARIGLQTYEPVALSAAQVGFVFDPTITTGPAVVLVDSRHGNAIFEVDQSAPGFIFVTLASPDSSLNFVPGDVISIDLPTSTSIPVGTISPVVLDPRVTFGVAPDGTLIDLVFESDEIEFR